MTKDIAIPTEDGVTAYWVPPLRVSDDVKSRAAQAAEAIAQWQIPVKIGTVKTWILSLGNFVKVSSRVTKEDATLKASAYADMMNHPAIVFSRDNLAAAARRFEFFPSFSELDAFLAEKATEAETLRSRLSALASLEPPKTMLPETLAAVGVSLAVIRTWFLTVDLLQREEGDPVVVAPTKFHRDWIMNNHDADIRRALRVDHVEIIADGDPVPPPRKLVGLEEIKAVLAGTVRPIVGADDGKE